jgi:hypothetical protein
MRKHDKRGRFARRADENSNKMIGFRVTESEFALIKQAKERGFEPRAVVLEKARKVVADDRVD